MNAEQFAEFYERQGLRTARSHSCWWYSPHPYAFVSIPFHRVVSPSRGELAGLFTRHIAAVVRFPTPHTTTMIGGIFLCSDREYSMERLERRARNRVRRGLENCTIERIDCDCLARNGLAAARDTMLRQGRHSEGLREASWKVYCDAIKRTPDTEVWGAFVGGRLASVLVAALVEEYLTFLYQCSATETLSCSPNNALVYTVTRDCISRPSVKFVTYGLQSVEKLETLDHFKHEMGFALHRLDFQVLLNPCVALAASCGGRNVLRWWVQRHPSDDYWRKCCRLLHSVDLTVSCDYCSFHSRCLALGKPNGVSVDLKA